VETAKALGLYKNIAKLLVAAGSRTTAVCTEEGELFTFGNGLDGKLGHGGGRSELMPRLVEALAGKKAIGVATGTLHTAVWTEAGELFTFGIGQYGKAGPWRAATA